MKQEEKKNLVTILIYSNSVCFKQVVHYGAA